jgi:hypothetical protein
MMPEAGEVVSNLKRVECSYDEELPTPIVAEPLPYTDTSDPQLIEEEQRLFEENYRSRAAYRWQGQERWMGRENEEMRLVNILHPHAIFQKFKNAGVDCSIEAAVDWVWDIDHKTGLTVPAQRTRSTARFWLHDVVIRDRIGITGWVRSNGRRVVKYITHLQHPLSPEWSLMRFDEFDVPTSERYRGWRTAVLRLIQEGVVTEDEVDRAFGPVTQNAASELYLEQLADFRKTGGRP